MRNFVGEFSYLGNISARNPGANVDANGNIIYLDNAATQQRPLSVISAMDKFHRNYNANVHRGIHWMADTATAELENTRQKIATFINAPSTRNIIFTSGTTHAINIIANGLKPKNVISSYLEHHANIVPWQLYNANIIVIDIDEKCELEDIEVKLSLMPEGAVVALAHISNVAGTINNIKEIIRMAHAYGHYVVIDGAQAIGHTQVDVINLDCDFYCFSGHKMYGPMGTGILYGKENLLEKIPPFMGGGEMIEHVGFDKTTFNDLPYKFEAGTPNVSGIIGLGSAVDFVQKHMESIKQDETDLTQYAYSRLIETDSLRIIGPDKRGPLVSFVIDNIHPHDLSQFLDHQGIAVRSGHHCAEPLHTILGINGTTRASFAIYNTREDVDSLIEGIDKARNFFGHI